MHTQGYYNQAQIRVYQMHAGSHKKHFVPNLTLSMYAAAIAKFEVNQIKTTQGENNSHFDISDVIATLKSRSGSP